MQIENRDIVIARSMVEDAEEILSLQKLAFQSQAELYDDHTLPPLRQTLEELREEFASHIVLKAMRNNVIVGSVRGVQKEDGECYVGRLVVQPGLQGQGIGRVLLSELERFFPDARRFDLFTGHRSERGLRLYRRLGYTLYREEAESDLLTLVYLEKRVDERRHE